MPEMASYHYLISSLPMLSRGKPAPITIADFLSVCESQLTAEDFEALREVKLEPGGKSSCSVGQGWQAFETYLRNSVVRARASAHGVRPEEWMREEIDVFPGIQHRFDDALTAREPLTREKIFDDLRWQHIEDSLVGHHFDFDALAGYYLKLQLAAKWARFDTDAGLERYQGLVEGCVEEAASRRKVREE